MPYRSFAAQRSLGLVPSAVSTVNEEVYPHTGDRGGDDISFNTLACLGADAVKIDFGHNRCDCLLGKKIIDIEEIKARLRVTRPSKEGVPIYGW